MKEKIYKFRIESDEEGMGFTDYGTKAQMQFLFFEAIERMRRFGRKQNITQKGDIDYKNFQATYNWDDLDTIRIYITELPQFNTRSSRELSEEMNAYFKSCF